MDIDKVLSMGNSRIDFQGSSATALLSDESGCAPGLPTGFIPWHNLLQHPTVEDGSFYLFANVRAIPGLLLGTVMRCSWEITSYVLVLSFPFFC